MAATVGRHPETVTDEVHKAAWKYILESRTLITTEINGALKQRYRSLQLKRS